MQITEKLSQQFGTWLELFRPFIESEAFDKIFGVLKASTKAGKEIYPKSAEVFKSFELCDRHKMKALILLQSPYPTKRNGVVVANGIPMDCSNIAPYQQPTMWQWYQAMEEQYGFDPFNDLRCDLSYLLQEEHVMLLNSSLTIEAGKPDSHAQLWEPFMKYFFEEIIDKYYKGLPIVLIGKPAQVYEKYIMPISHYIKKVEHPAAASYQNRAWKHEQLFTWINDILKKNNGAEYKVEWFRKKGVEVNLVKDKSYFITLLLLAPLTV
jgi:uracil-DNA glycosylase